MNALQPTETVAVLTLSETGEILAAREACAAVFGREVGALIGVNVRVLLKGGLDNEVGRLLHGFRSGKNPDETAPLQVAALKRDGTDFTACVTTRKWNAGTAITKKSDAARLTWTIEIRDLSSPGDKTQQIQSVEPPADESSGSGPGSEPRSAAVRSATGELAAAGSANGLEGGTVVSSQNANVGLCQHDVEEQLHKVAEELAAFKTEASRRMEEQQKLELELRAQLEAAKESANRAESALKEESERKGRLEERLQTLSSSLRLEQAERSKRFEQELISLRQERDELDRKFAVEQKAGSESSERAADLEKRLAKNAADFERARGELEQQNEERQRVESAWREQLDTAFIAKKQIEGAWAGEVERSKRLEEQLAQLRQEHDELAGKLASEQTAAAESRQRAKEVEGRLGRNAVESDRARSELEKEAAERERLESEWRGQLAEAHASREKSELALTEARRANKRLEQELARLQAERNEVNEKWVMEQRAAAESHRRAETLQRTVNQNSAELERIRGIHDRVEKGRLESTERALKLERDLESAENRCDGLTAKLAAHQTAAEKLKGRVQELKDLLDHRTADLEKAQAELNDRVEHRDRLEAEWKKQLDQAKAQAKEFESAWTGAVDRNMHFEEMLSTLRAERDDLVRKLKAEKQSAGQGQQRFDEFQEQLRQRAAEVAQLKSELDKRRIEQARAEAELNKRLETATALTKKLEAAWTEVVQRNQRLESQLEALRHRPDRPVAESKPESALAKPVATPQPGTIRAAVQREQRDRGKAAPEKITKVEPNGAGLNGGHPSSPKALPGAKLNGHESAEGTRTDGSLGSPPKPSVGLYNLKP